MEQLLQEILDLYGMDREVFFGKRKFVEVTTARKHLINLAIERGMSTSEIKAFMNIDHNSMHYYRQNPVLPTTPENARATLPMTMMIEGGATLEEVDAAFPDQPDLVRKIMRRALARTKSVRVTNKHKAREGLPIDNMTVKDTLSSLGLRMGSITSLIISSMTPEVRAYWIKTCLDDGYETLEECFADFLTDKYYEAQQ